MFTINEFNNIEPLKIFLARPNGEIICSLNDILSDKASLTPGLNQQTELSIEVVLSQDSTDTRFDLLQEGMYLFVEKFGLFKMKQPTIEYTSITKTKSIIAFSCSVELEDKTIQMEINTGKKTSMEYLVEYDDNETELLLNPYTGIPYDWIVIYNTFPEQLREVKTKYLNNYYGTSNNDGEIVVTNTSKISELQDLFTLIPRLKSKIVEVINSQNTEYTAIEYAKFEYDSNGNITTTTLLSNFQARITELITFYTKYRKQLSLLSLILEAMDGNWTVGEVFGILEGNYSLANKKYQFEINENIYSFLTNTLPEPSKCLVNFDELNRKVNIIPIENIGEDTGINLSYNNLVESLNISCNEDNLTTRLYVYGNDSLNIKQVNFGLDYIDDINYKINARDENGKRIYVNDTLANKYEQYIEYRENLRGQYIQCTKDYAYYDEQITKLKYKVPDDILKTDWGTFKYEELEESLKTYKNMLTTLITLYKNDFGDVGLNSIGGVNENYIKNTIYWHDYKTYLNTIDEINCAMATYPYYSDQDKWTQGNITTYKNLIKAWETEWTLYGEIELQHKIDTYTSNMKLLLEKSVIATSSNSDTIKTWNQLSTAEKESFGNLQTNYFYDTYMEYYNLRESAKIYLAQLQTQIDNYKELQDSAQNTRKEIISSISFENHFTSDECKILNLLYRDSDYTNSNILVTSIDTSSEKVDKMVELLEDGKEKVSALCRPQLTFDAKMDNLFGLVKFKPLWEKFMLGNYILVQYKDNTYVKLRLIGFSFNPVVPTSNDFTITFSNYIRSKAAVTDLENLLGLSSSGSSRGLGGGSSNSNEDYGESDDIDITISNTMLSKLLNSELFGTRVSNVILDTVESNSLTAKYATFGGLTNGETKIDGKCLTSGYIIDSAYNGANGSISNTSGSIINLENGTFNFGGGSLVYSNGILNISGDGSGIVLTNNANYNSAIARIAATENGLLTKVEKNGVISAIEQSSEQVQISANKINLNGVVTANSYFKINNDGSMETKSGKIANWNINTNCLYSNSSTFGASDGIYFGTSGLSLTNKFTVDSNGNLTCLNANITGDIHATTMLADSSYYLYLPWYNTNSILDESGNQHSINGKIKIISSLNALPAYILSENTQEVTYAYSSLIVGRLTNYKYTGEYGEVTFDSENCIEFRDMINIVRCQPEENYGQSFKYTSNTKCTIYSDVTQITGSLFVDRDTYINDGLDVGGKLNCQKLETSEDIRVGTNYYIYCPAYDDSSIHYPNSTTTLNGIVSIISRHTENKSIRFGRMTFFEDGNLTYNYGNYFEFTDSESSGSAWSKCDLRSNKFNIYCDTEIMYKLKVNGSLTTNGNIYTSSDKRLKKHVSDINTIEDFYMDLKPVEFKYLNNSKNDEPITFGFYAQDIVDSLIKQKKDWNKYAIVSKDSDDMYSLGYQNFIALNTYMIQKVYKENEKLRNELEMLKSQVSQLI